MNILLITPFGLTEIGGVTTFVSRLQESVNDRGHRALVLHAGGASDRIAPARVGGRHGVYEIYLRSIYIRGVALKAFVAFWVYLPLTLYELWTFLRRERIEVVHIHFPMPLAAYFSIFRFFSLRPLVVTLHGSDVYALPRRTWLYRLLVGFVFWRVDLIVAATADLFRVLKVAYPRLRTPTRIIFNGNPLVEPAPPSAPPSQSLTSLPQNYVLAVGSLIPRKAYDVLLRALRLASDQGFAFELVIVGGGSEDSNLAALARELKVEDRVFFTGPVNHREIMNFYPRAKFFVHAARDEAQGLVLLEAMSCRKAVIATCVQGIPELIHDGENGLLVEPDNPEALAAAMIRLERDKALRSSLAGRGYDLVTQQYTWARFIDQYLGAYEKRA